jgi:hypothetical protein
MLLLISMQERTDRGDVTYILFIGDACDVQEVLAVQRWKWLLCMKTLRKRLSSLVSFCGAVMDFGTAVRNA